MLDAKEIDIEIARLEYLESSYPNYAKLADLYAIRDHMQKKNRQIPDYDMSYSTSPSKVQTLGEYGDSEFLRIVSGKDAEEMWHIMDDLMDTHQIANPRLYNGILRKIRAASN